MEQGFISILEKLIIPQNKQLVTTMVTAASTTGGIEVTPKIGSIIPFGGYNWLVLDKQNNLFDEQNNKVLLLSEKIIEKRAYHSSKFANTWNYLRKITWEDCTLRSYLNGAFYNTFSEEETFYNTFSADDKARIAETKVIIKKDLFSGCKGSVTIDRIFLLSAEEVVKYFGDSSQFKDGIPRSGRRINDQYNYAIVAGDADGEGSWWLSSPGCVVCTSVNDNEFGFGFGPYVNSDNGGVRPALWLNL